jgi:hypothetical protein
MARVLHLPTEPQVLKAGLVAVRQPDPAIRAGRGLKFLTVNTLWGQKHYGFQPAFLKTLKSLSRHDLETPATPLQLA